jgi:hypothetical protein
VLGCYDLSSVVLVGVVRQSPHAVDVMSSVEVYFSSSSKDSKLGCACQACQNAKGHSK